MRNKNVSMEERFKAVIKLSDEPRDSAKIHVNRCRSLVADMTVN